MIRPPGELVEDSAGGWYCPYCRRRHNQPFVHNCPSTTPAAEPGLGDYVEKWLTAAGITKSRYREIKRLFGFPPTCRCEERQAWLNRVGEYFGIGAPRQ